MVYLARLSLYEEVQKRTFNAAKRSRYELICQQDSGFGDPRAFWVGLVRSTSASKYMNGRYKQEPCFLMNPDNK